MSFSKGETEKFFFQMRKP